MAGGADRLFGADRYVLYLDAAVQTLIELDGSREQGIRREAESFCDSPESAFDKQPAEHVYQVRDLTHNVRAFATWCQNESLTTELFVVQDIYEKSNERDFWATLGAYNSEGEKFEDEFETLSSEQFRSWVRDQQDGPRILVTP